MRPPEGGWIFKVNFGRPVYPSSRPTAISRCLRPVAIATAVAGSRPPRSLWGRVPEKARGDSAAELRRN